MLQLSEQQGNFAAALLDPNRPIPHGLVGPDGEPSTRRFGVYRNNVVLGLIEALRNAFPVVERLVGAEFFSAMAGNYARLTPPCSPIMLNYGASFPDYIAQFEPAATIPYLYDVARIERAWTEAYHAPDALPIDPMELMAVAIENLPEIRLNLHPSLRLIRSRFPSLTIWHMNTTHGVPKPLDINAAGEDTLLVRPMADVELRLLPAGSGEFVQAIMEGASLTDAMTVAIAADRRFDLSSSISGLIEAQAVINFNISGAQESLDLATPPWSR